MKTSHIVAVIIVIVIIAALSFAALQTTGTVPGQYDDFAQCLTDNGAVFYGSFECPHCTTQKNLFGNSMKFVNYVECGPLGGPIRQECRDAEITAYPTWIINGSQYLGTQELTRLGELTNCSLTTNEQTS